MPSSAACGSLLAACPALGAEAHVQRESSGHYYQQGWPFRRACLTWLLMWCVQEPEHAHAACLTACDTNARPQSGQ